MSRFSVVIVLTYFVQANLALAQNQPASDPKALAYAAQSIAALTAGGSVSLRM